MEILVYVTWSRTRGQLWKTPAAADAVRLSSRFAVYSNPAWSRTHENRPASRNAYDRENSTFDGGQTGNAT